MSATEEFAKTSWDWQLSLFQRQVGEWIELQLSRFNSSIPNFDPNWSLDIPWLVDLIKALIWLLIIAILAWLVWQLWRVLEPYLYSWRKQNQLSTANNSQLTQLSVQDWVKQSQIYFHQGNIKAACLCLYQAMLQQLHDTGIAPHQASRTDGEYQQLLANLPKSPAYQTLIATHEQLCFGNGEISPATYQQCQQAYQEIDKL